MIVNNIGFRNGSFSVSIYLPMLPENPARSTRKLLRLLFAEPGENRDAIETLTRWLNENLDIVRQVFHGAELLQKAEHKSTCKACRHKVCIEKRKQNRILDRTVAAARTALTQLEKLQSIISEFIKGET